MNYDTFKELWEQYKGSFEGNLDDVTQAILAQNESQENTESEDEETEAAGAEREYE